MKCIHCDISTTYKTRMSNGGRCGGCRHLFAFEPKTDSLKLADGQFLRIIKLVSGDDAVWYTEKQLWYEFNRQTAKRKIGSCGASVLLWLLVLPAAHAISSRHVAAAAACLAAGAALAAVSKAPAKPKPPLYAPVSLAKFRLDYLRKWIHVHGEPVRLLPEVDLTPSGASHVQKEDLSAFSFDRALVTQHADIAAMLVANNFHFENNCAILSLDGYPIGRFATVFQMLGNNPNLTVFALHDASTSGVELPATLRTPQWFPDPGVRIVDLGLRPLHAIKSNMILLKTDPPAQRTSTRSSLNADELGWLAEGNHAEVSNVRPAKLMRAIFQGFNLAAQTASDGTTVYDDDGVMIWMYDPGMDVYAFDSFG